MRIIYYITLMLWSYTLLAFSGVLIYLASDWVGMAVALLTYTVAVIGAFVTTITVWEKIDDEYRN